MADGVAISAGSGTLILTDDTGGTGHAQVMKLAISTDGSPTLIPATADGLAVLARPETSGGCTIHRTISAASTNSTSVKGSAGQVYGYLITNTNTNPRYVKLYNKATSPTVGSDTPVMTIMVPPGGGENLWLTHGLPFATGIALAITTGAADADTGAVAANEIIVHLFYK